MSTLLIVLLVLLLIGAFPIFSYNQNWGYGPGGLIGLILVVMLLLMLTGNLHLGRL